MRFSPCGCCCDIFVFSTETPEDLLHFENGVIFSPATPRAFDGILESMDSIEVKKEIDSTDVHWVNLHVDAPSGEAVQEWIGDVTWTNPSVQIDFLPPVVGTRYKLEIDLSHAQSVQHAQGFLIPPGTAQQLFTYGDLPDVTSHTYTGEFEDGGLEPDQGTWQFDFDTDNFTNLTITRVKVTVITSSTDGTPFEYTLEARNVDGDGWTLQLTDLGKGPIACEDNPAIEVPLDSGNFFKRYYLSKYEMWQEWDQSAGYIERGYVAYGYFEDGNYYKWWYGPFAYFNEDTGEGPFTFVPGLPSAMEPYNYPNDEVRMFAWEEELGLATIEASGEYAPGRNGIPVMMPWTRDLGDLTVTLTNDGTRPFEMSEFVAQKIVGLEPDDSYECTTNSRLQLTISGGYACPVRKPDDLCSGIQYTDIHGTYTIRDTDAGYFISDGTDEIAGNRMQVVANRITEDADGNRTTEPWVTFEISASPTITGWVWSLDELTPDFQNWATCNDGTCDTPTGSATMGKVGDCNVTTGSCGAPTWQFSFDWAYCQNVLGEGPYCEQEAGQPVNGACDEYIPLCPKLDDFRLTMVDVDAPEIPGLPLPDRHGVGKTTCAGGVESFCDLDSSGTPIYPADILIRRNSYVPQPNWVETQTVGPWEPVPGSPNGDEARVIDYEWRVDPSETLWTEYRRGDISQLWHYWFSYQVTRIQGTNKATVTGQLDLFYVPSSAVGISERFESTTTPPGNDETPSVRLECTPVPSEPELHPPVVDEYKDTDGKVYLVCDQWTKHTLIFSEEVDLCDWVPGYEFTFQNPTSGAETPLSVLGDWVGEMRTAGPAPDEDVAIATYTEYDDKLAGRIFYQDCTTDQMARYYRTTYTAADVDLSGVTIKVRIFDPEQP